MSVDLTPGRVSPPPFSLAFTSWTPRVLRVLAAKSAPRRGCAPDPDDFSDFLRQKEANFRLLAHRGGRSVGVLGRNRAQRVHLCAEDWFQCGVAPLGCTKTAARRGTCSE